MLAIDFLNLVVLKRQFSLTAKNIDYLVDQDCSEKGYLCKWEAHLVNTTILSQEGQIVYNTLNIALVL